MSAHPPSDQDGEPAGSGGEQTTQRGDAGGNGQTTQRADVSAQTTQRADLAEQTTQRADLHEQSTQRADDATATSSWKEDPRYALSAGKCVADRYELISRFPGASGEADVWRCRDLHEESEVVIKVYRAGYAPDEKVVMPLRNLVHPHLVTLRDVGQWEGRFFEVQEFCRGGTVAEANEGRPLDPAQLRSIVEHTSEGLHALHLAGVNHRDVKPGNIFFRDVECRRAVVGDFGIARSVAEGVTVRFDGTWEYMAPELHQGDFGPKSDFYALGITLLALLRGGKPFVDKNGREMSQKVYEQLKSREEIPIPEDCPATLAALILGLTRYGVAPRWGYAQVIQWLKGEPVRMDDGRPDTEYSPGGTRRTPYVSDREVGTPGELARKLGKNFSPHDDYFQKIKSELFKGKISQWLAEKWEDLSREVVKIEEDYTAEPELGVFLLRYTLNRQEPLTLSNRAEAQNFEEFANLLERAVRNGDLAGGRDIDIPDEDGQIKGKQFFGHGVGVDHREAGGVEHEEFAVARALTEALGDLLDRGELQAWLKVAVEAPWLSELLEEIDRLRDRLNEDSPERKPKDSHPANSPSKPLATAPARVRPASHPPRNREQQRLRVFALYYAIRPKQPFHLSSTVAISSPSQIGDVLSHTVPTFGFRQETPARTSTGEVSEVKGLTDRLTALLYGGFVAEWFKYAFADQPELERWARSCVQRFKDNKALGFAALRWHFEPKVGFEFAGQVVHSPQELAGAIDKTKGGYELAWKLVTGGMIGAWLEETAGGANIPLDRLIADGHALWATKVETLIQVMDPALPKPRLSVTELQKRPLELGIDLGDVPGDGSEDFVFHVENLGRGYLSGFVSTEGTGLVVKEGAKIEGAPTSFTVTVRPRDIPVGRRHEAHIKVQTTGGTKQILFRFSVTAPIREMIRNSLTAGTVGAVLLGLLRWGLSAARPEAEQWLPWAEFDSLLKKVDDSWGADGAGTYLFFAIPFLLISGGFLYYIISLVKRLNAPHK